MLTELTRSSRRRRAPLDSRRSSRRAMQSRWQRTRLPAPEAVVVCSGAVQPCVVFDDRCLRQPLRLEVSRSHWWRSQALFQIRDRPPRRRRRPRSCGQRCTLCDPGRNDPHRRRHVLHTSSGRAPVDQRQGVIYQTPIGAGAQNFLTSEGPGSTETSTINGTTQDWIPPPTPSTRTSASTGAGARSPAKRQRAPTASRCSRRQVRLDAPQPGR